MSSVALAWSGARSRISVLTRSCSKRFMGVATRIGLRVSRHSLSSVEYLFGQWRADNRVTLKLNSHKHSIPHERALRSTDSAPTGLITSAFFVFVIQACLCSVVHASEPIVLDLWPAASGAGRIGDNFQRLELGPALRSVLAVPYNPKNVQGTPIAAVE